MQCANCLAENAPDAPVCTRCGVKLGNPYAAPAAAFEDVRPAAPSDGTDEAVATIIPYKNASALIAYRLAIVAVTGTFSLVEAGMSFVVVGLGGIAVGVVVGWLITNAWRRTSDAPGAGASYEHFVNVATVAASAPPRARGRYAIVGVTALLALAGALAFGAARYYSRYREAMATAEQRRDFVPSLRVATVVPSDPFELVTLPATTLAFEAANVYARASGYVAKRYVDIGDHVKGGQLLVEITAPELDHQIAQNEATLAQLKATQQ